MIKLEQVNTTPKFSDQLENKVLYSDHAKDISITYKSTYTLKYVIEGTKYYYTNSQSTKVGKNQYLILNSANELTTEAKKGTKGLSFFLSPELINEIHHYNNLTNTDLNFLEVIQRKSTDTIGNLLDKIIPAFQHKTLANNHTLEDLFIKLSEAIVLQQNNLNERFSSLQIVKYNTRQELFKFVALTKEYLNDNLSENISLNKISGDIGVSKYYLHRLFTQLNGATPLEYLTLLRLKKAKKELKKSTSSIMEIAVDCGFENTPYFSNTFKKHIGVSPTQFRNKP